MAEEVSECLFGEQDEEASLSVYGEAECFDSVEGSGAGRFLMSTSGHRSANVSLAFLTGVSFFGLVLAGALMVNPPVSGVDFVWRKPVVGSIFALICVLGSLAAVFPGACSRGFGSVKRESGSGHVHFGFGGGVSGSAGDSAVLRGHHPACGVFSSHVFRVGGGVFCATCSGLLLGGVLSLVGVVVYFFVGFSVGGSVLLVGFVGLAGVAVGLLQSVLIRVRWSFVRVLSGLVFAVGALLILVAVDGLVGDLFLDVFVVLLSVFWIFTRVSLSRWEHDGMCSACDSVSCVLGER